MRLDAVRKKLPTLSNINSESLLRVINDIWPNTNERKIYYIWTVIQETDDPEEVCISIFKTMWEENCAADDSL